ncbi:MAG: hypothetical protein J6C23_03030 [Clostridia bacterium]|nr:hypothetical protein [Clostridia bacterium]
MFDKAIAITIPEIATEPNVFATFHANLNKLENCELRICAHSFYQIYLNGKFIAFGPARTAKNYARTDIIPLNSDEPKNELIIILVGYNCRCLSTVLQPMFIQAEVVANEKVIAYTGKDFNAYTPICKVQKTERYSWQRHYTEIWDFRNENIFSTSRKANITTVKNPPKPIYRNAPYPNYSEVLLPAVCSKGKLLLNNNRPVRRNLFSGTMTDYWVRFNPAKNPYNPHEWIQLQEQIKESNEQKLPVTLKESTYVIFDFNRIETGFFKIIADVLEDTELIVAFSETSTRDEFSFSNMNVHNVIQYNLKKGDELNCLSFEPYTAKFAIVAVKTGSIKLNTFGIKTYEFDTSHIKIPDCKDETLNAVYKGGLRTFAHNAVDIYTDCPSRERAGWLCDSYFTAKTEYALTGNTRVEDDFLENYVLFKNAGEYPDGMIPMCFPSDIEESGKFIPQWSMWFILEVEDYVNNRKGKFRKEFFKEKISGLLSFYSKYENEDGLLEKLPSWNFVEWSKANEWTQDVNYPTNFLYARVLHAVYKLYGDENYLKKSIRIAQTATKQSFDGELFYDHAVRNTKGELELVKTDCTEICQYYAVLYANIDLSDKKYVYLLNLIKNVFGAIRKKTMNDIVEINAFIGIYLRLEALLKLKEYNLAIQDIKDFFGHMEQSTGTLWEYRQEKGSKDHGFASYVISVIEECVKNSK